MLVALETLLHVRMKLDLGGGGDFIRNPVTAPGWGAVWLLNLLFGDSL
jgi:hypothetical protein